MREIYSLMFEPQNDATPGRSSAGAQGSFDLSAPGLRPDRCRSEQGEALEAT